jgi:hypothetical protein
MYNLLFLAFIVLILYWALCDYPSGYPRVDKKPPDTKEEEDE